MKGNIGIDDCSNSSKNRINNITNNKTKRNEADDKINNRVITINNDNNIDDSVISNYRRNKSDNQDDCNVEENLSANQNDLPTTDNNSVGNERMRELEVDEILEEVGAFGVAQKVVLLVLYLMIIPHSIHMFSWTLSGLSPAWKCTQNNRECNVTGVFDLGDRMYESRCGMKRNSWQFVEEHDFSIVTEWDLVCEKKEYAFFFNSLTWIGWAFGAFVFGFLSGRYGRKKILFFSLTLQLVGSLGCAFVPWMWVYAALAFTVGFAQGGVALGIFILSSELVTPKYKSLTSGAGAGLMNTFSLCLLSAQAWLVKKWRVLMITTTAPYFILLLCYKVVPESVRWLRLNGRIKEAECILQRYSKINKKKWPANTTLSHPAVSEEKKDSLAGLFQKKTVAFNMLILMFVWFSIGQVFAGITMASDQLSGNIYRDFALTSLVGIPANILVLILTNRFGRKPTLIASLGTGSLACLGIAFIHPKSPYVWTRVAFAMIGQMGMSLSLSTMYTWSMELMPTSVRSQGMGVLSVITRIGGSSAPWIAQWLEHVHWILPFIVMSAFTLLSLIVCIRVPETKDVPTIETIQQLKRLLEGNSDKDVQVEILVNALALADKAITTSRRVN